METSDQLEMQELMRRLEGVQNRFESPAQRKLNLVKKNLDRKSYHFKRTFKAEDGIIVLEALKAEFDGTNIAMPGDSHMTHYFLGCRDVIKYIEQMIEYDPHKEK